MKGPVLLVILVISCQCYLEIELVRTPSDSESTKHHPPALSSCNDETKSDQFR